MVLHEMYNIYEVGMFKVMGIEKWRNQFKLGKAGSWAPAASTSVHILEEGSIPQFGGHWLIATQGFFRFIC